jgi:hypothetical protein
MCYRTRMPLLNLPVKVPFIQVIDWTMILHLASLWPFDLTTSKLLGVIFWSGAMIFIGYTNHGSFLLSKLSDKDFTWSVMVTSWSVMVTLTLDLKHPNRLFNGHRQCPHQIKLTRTYSFSSYCTNKVNGPLCVHTDQFYHRVAIT